MNFKNCIVIVCVTNDLQTTFHTLFHMNGFNVKNKTGAEIILRIGCLQIISK
jgi:hypothetical protein